MAAAVSSRQQQRQIEGAGGGQGAGGEQQGVAGEKRGHHHAGLEEDHDEEDAVTPDAVILHDLQQVAVDVQEEVDGAREKVHGLPAIMTGGMGCVKKTSKGITLRGRPDARRTAATPLNSPLSGGKFRSPPIRGGAGRSGAEGFATPRAASAAGFKKNRRAGERGPVRRKLGAVGPEGAVCRSLDVCSNIKQAMCQDCLRRC